MFGRTFVMTLGLVGALGAAQFPAFSQQYMQRLGGAVGAVGEAFGIIDDLTSDNDSLVPLARLRGTAWLVSNSNGN